MKSLHTGFWVPAEKVKGVRPREVEPEGPQHPQLHLPDLRGGVSVVRDVDEVIDLRGEDLLHLACNEHGRHPDQLEFLTANGDSLALTETTRGY